MLAFCFGKALFAQPGNTIAFREPAGASTPKIGLFKLDKVFKMVAYELKKFYIFMSHDMR